MASRISIINFKGGVGKTTLGFHLGTGLAWRHNARVLLVDMDHQSSLSILCLGPDGWQTAVDGERTVDQIFRSFVGTDNALPDRDIILNSPMDRIDRDYHRMDLIPASLRLDDIEIELTASHQGNAIQSEWNKRTLLCRWLDLAQKTESTKTTITLSSTVRRPPKSCLKTPLHLAMATSSLWHPRL